MDPRPNAGVPLLRVSELGEFVRHRSAEILAEQRLGHQVPGMRGLYAHASDRMRDELKQALQTRWQGSLNNRAAPPSTRTHPCRFSTSCWHHYARRGATQP